MTLSELATTILSLSPTPISKLRFARVIYFVHKELIRKGLMRTDDILYRRAPLGPVPEHLQQLPHLYDAIVVQKSDSALSYADEEFTISNESRQNQETETLEQYRDILKIVDRTLKALSNYTTPEIIEASHDPSWQQHYNGAIYTITPADLKNSFPFTLIRLKSRSKPNPNTLGQIQANLLRGMISDIVKESTDLEYPDDPTTNQPTPHQPPRSITIKIFPVIPKKYLDLLKNRSKKPAKITTKHPKSSPKQSKDPSGSKDQPQS